MQAQRWGRVVTIGSGTAKQLVRSGLNFGYVLANTTRVSAAALAKTVAGEVADQGITINTIGTGYIDTESNRSWTHGPAAAHRSLDLTSGVEGQSGSVSVNHGGSGSIKKKTKEQN